MQQRMPAKNPLRILLLLALAFALLPLQSASAATATIYVLMQGGHDTLCDGKTNEPLSGAAGTNCAKATVPAAIEAAAAGDTIYVNGGTYTNPFYYNINYTSTPYQQIHVTKAVDIKLADWTYIQTLTGGFVASALEPNLISIEADNVRIYAEHPGKAFLKNRESRGIYVKSGLKDIIIDGLDIAGYGNTISNNLEAGIYFAGAVTDLQIVNNSFSHFGNGYDLVFSSVPTGVVDIQGNFFGKTTNDATSKISLPTGSNLNLKYNSWDNLMDGPSAVDKGVLNSSGSSFSDWTYAYLQTSSDSLFALVGTKIDVVVSVTAKNVTGTDFKLGWDTDQFTLTGVTISTATNPFPIKMGYEGITSSGAIKKDTDLAAAMADKANPINVLHFYGLTSDGSANPATSALSTYSGSANTPLKILTAKFKVKSSGMFSLDNSDYNFSMDPGYGPSNLVYMATDSGIPNPEIPGLRSLSVVALAIDGLVTGRVSMQGRVSRDGAKVIFTNTTSATPATPDFETTSSDNITDNVSFASGPWTDGWFLSTNKQGYLDVLTGASGNNKVVNFSSTHTFNALELKGGDANDDNVISVLDAGLIGTDYGGVGRIKTLDSDGVNVFTDINSSGQVDIYDLALMGGNYDLASLAGTVNGRTVTSAYNTGTGLYYWKPQ